MVTNYHPDLNATKHFLADYHDCPHLCGELQTRITLGQSEIVPATWRPVVDENNVPHSVVATTWRHFNQDGILTRERFNERLREALDDLAGRITQNGKFAPYPMRNQPRVVEGTAYHDFHVDEPYPLDVRLIIMYGQITIDETHDVAYGLSFHLVTLVGKDSHA
jgi:hypothetical protein